MYNQQKSLLQGHSVSLIIQRLLMQIICITENKPIPTYIFAFVLVTSGIIRNLYYNTIFSVIIYYTQYIFPNVFKYMLLNPHMLSKNLKLLSNVSICDKNGGFLAICMIDI